MHPPAATTDIDVSILVPIFNEVENIPSLVREIEKTFEKSSYSFELIAVDDGSSDGSFQELKRLVAEKQFLRVIRFRRNMGQTAAFDAGFSHARGRFVVTMDADLQSDPIDILPMIEMLGTGYDFVTGWRKDRKDGFWLRRVPSLLANKLIRIVTGTPLHDLGCSLKVYKREISDELKLYGEMHRFINILVQDIGAKVGEVVVNHRPRVAGKSKYGLSRTVKVLLDLLTVWFFLKFRTKPIYVFGGFGVIVSFLGLFFAAVAAWDKIVSGILVHNNPFLILGTMCGIIGVQFIAFGLVSEIIIRTYYESRHQRPYSIAEVV